MNRCALVLLAGLTLLVAPLSRGQIPNAGFETWAGGLPTGWSANPLTVSQSTTAHTGSSALQGKVATIVGHNIGPYIFSNFGVNQRYATFTGWYQYTPVGGDSMYCYLIIGQGSTAIGYAAFATKTTRASYQQFSATLTYFAPGVPDTCEIFMAILGTSSNGDTVHFGSTFLLDDLALTGTAAGIEQMPGSPLSYRLEQNYPNPFNPSTVITYELKSAGSVRLAVYDILGREVAILAEGEQAAGPHEARFDGQGLASGVYFYRLQAGEFVQQKKMLLEK